MLQCIVKLGKFISQDSFRMAQVSQIDILPNAEFEIVPSIGSQLIELGDTSDLDKKFIKLITFYKQTVFDNTINNYSKIYLQFKVKRTISDLLPILTGGPQVPKPCETYILVFPFCFNPLLTSKIFRVI